jgi:hypothetical protein
VPESLLDHYSNVIKAIAQDRGVPLPGGTVSAPGSAAGLPLAVDQSPRIVGRLVAAAADA